MGACGAECGITRQRDREREVARRVARAVWPEGRRAASGALRGLGVDPERVSALAARLVETLPVAVLEEPEEPDRAPSIYCIATVADETWVGFRCGRSPRPAHRVELGLRVAFSPFGPYATLQEVHLEADVDDEGVWIEERRLAGVEDRRMQHLVRGVQGALRKARVTALDAAFLAEPFGDGTLWSALFDAEPAVATRGDYLPAGAPPAP
ncbi:MAG: hypothetical protein R3A48_02980 [Polyangiales bacterium]